MAPLDRLRFRVYLRSNFLNHILESSKMSSGIAAQCPAWSISGYLDVNQGRLNINGVDAIELVKQFNSPLFVFSEARIRDNINRLKRAGDVVDRPIKFC